MATAPLAKAPSPPAAPNGADSPASPLGVALDGALLRTDTLHEALLWLVRHRPAQALWLLLAAFRGPAFLRRRATALAALDPQTLPLDDDLVADLRRQRAAGRRLVLCSSADGELVEAVAARVGLFDRAVGGDQPAAAAAAAPPLEARLRPARGGLRNWVRALRLHQWSKNALLLVPLGLAGPLASAADYAAGLLGFLVFGLLASAGYLVNDLLDLEADRRHRSKRHRPFAAGDLSPAAGIAAAALLLLLAAGFCALLPGDFAAVACVYLVGTLAYSLRLKRVPLLDVLMLAGLFTVRILAGAMLTPTPLSFWLLTFSMFLFLSLALVKRYTELSEAAAADDDGAAMLASRGYDRRDLPLILPLGLGSALAAATIFVIYLVDEKFPTEIYRRPEYLWLVFPILLFWLMRVWRLAVHGRMHDDPVLFALKDRLSLALGGAIGVLLTLAW